MTFDIAKFRGVDITTGQWKGWTQYGNGACYQKLFGDDTIHYYNGWFEAYKHSNMKDLRGKFNTLKEALEALK